MLATGCACGIWATILGGLVAATAGFAVFTVARWRTIRVRLGGRRGDREIADAYRAVKNAAMSLAIEAPQPVERTQILSSAVAELLAVMRRQRRWRSG